MYNLISALALRRNIGAQWETVDLSNILVYQIFNEFVKVYLTLSTVYATENVFIDLDILREEFSAYDKTLPELLSGLGNKRLPTVTSLPNSRVRYSAFSDAFRAGYKVETVLIGQTTPVNYVPSDLKDLKLTRPNFDTNMRLIHTHCLVTVNGYLHRTDTDGEAAYVYDGRASMTKSRQNQIGIISFMDIGAVKKVPIKAENIYSQDSDSKLWTRTYLHLDEDITNKSVILVLGGYMVFPEDGVFWQTGEKTFAINFSSFPFIQRYFESSKYLDLSSLGLSVHSENKDIISTTELCSDEVLKKYLTLSQSFFVIVDTPNLFTNKYYIRDTKMPGMFVSYKEPTQPLITGFGKVSEYWKTEEDTQWSVTVQDSFLQNYTFSSRPTKELQNVTPAGIPTRTFKHSKGFLLEIGTYK